MKGNRPSLHTMNKCMPEEEQLHTINRVEWRPIHDKITLEKDNHVCIVGERKKKELNFGRIVKWL